MTAVIQAEPGWESLYFDNESGATSREPILGWRVDRYGAMPVLLGFTEEECQERPFILRPDGLVADCLCGRRWLSVDGWRSDMKKLADERRERARPMSAEDKQ